MFFNMSVQNIRVRVLKNLFGYWTEVWQTKWALEITVVMGLGQNILTRGQVWSIFCARVGSVRVSHLWFGFEFVKFPLTISIFLIFCPSGQKNLFGSGQRWVDLLFTVGQKKARVGSGPISRNEAHWLYMNLQQILNKSYQVS